jgi:hypothetical protein
VLLLVIASTCSRSGEREESTTQPRDDEVETTVTSAVPDSDPVFVSARTSLVVAGGRCDQLVDFAAEEDVASSTSFDADGRAVGTIDGLVLADREGTRPSAFARTSQDSDAVLIEVDGEWVEYERGSLDVASLSLVDPVQLLETLVITDLAEVTPAAGGAARYEGVAEVAADAIPEGAEVVALLDLDAAGRLRRLALTFPPGAYIRSTLVDCPVIGGISDIDVPQAERSSES